MYKIKLSAESKKFLKKLNKIEKKRILDTLKRCRIRPHSHVKKLISSPYFRLRIGNYRAILDIVDGNLIIYVLEINQRKSIYNSKLLK